jgi:hypothetical protein
MCVSVRARVTGVVEDVGASPGQAHALVELADRE